MRSNVKQSVPSNSNAGLSRESNANLSNMVPGLFQLGPFTGRSGTVLPFKIECNAITEDDWKAIARHAAEIVPPFWAAFGVPRGGLPFAREMNEYRISSFLSDCILICEDVWTTGGSIQAERERLKKDHPTAKFHGIVLFAHKVPELWCEAIFTRTL